MRLNVRRGKRARVLDREAPNLEQVGVFASEKIGPKRSLTPQGYMLCQDVPIARTGTMYYGPGDLPEVIKVGPQGYIRASRDEDQLFRPETLASFVGMPITDDHPEDGDVSPETWNERARGFVLNARQGEGELADCIVCDLMIMSKQTIDDIDSGKREVSAGYDSGYLQIEPGRVLQVNIMGNHVALVERGRCGPRCAIGDSATVDEGNTMPTPIRRTTPPKPARVPLNPALRRRIMDAAAEAITNAMEGGGDGVDDEEPPQAANPPPPDGAPPEPDMDDGGGGTHTHIHIHGLGGAEPAAAGAAPAAPGAGGNPPVPAAAGAGVQPATEGTPPGAADPSNASAQATPEDRLTALETGMQQILVAVKQLMGGGVAPAAPAGEPPAGDPPGANPAPPNAPTNDGAADEDDDMPPMPANGVTMDSESLSGVYASSKAMAEVLFPGFQFPEFDPKAPRTKTMDSICAARRRCLDMAYSTATGRKVVDTLRGSTRSLDVATLPCVKANLLFKAAAGVIGANRTADTVGHIGLPSGGAAAQPEGPRLGSMAWHEEQNRVRADFWKSRQPAVTK